MNGPENNSFINEALPVNNVDEFENKQDKIAEVICLFLPQQMTETVTSSEEQTVLLQLNEEPLYIINGDIPKYPLAIEETTVVNSENLNVGSEVVTTDNGIIKEGTNIIHDNDLKTQSIAQQEEKHFVNNFCQTSTEKEKNYICNLCKKSFIRKCDLNRHYKTHSTQKNYVCNFCQKSFRENYTLKLHLNIHTKEKNFVCNFCQKTLTSHASLKVHINLHTEEKQFVCKICLNTFNRRYDVKRHFRRHHAVKK